MHRGDQRHPGDLENLDYLWVLLYLAFLGLRCQFLENLFPLWDQASQLAQAHQLY